MSHSDGDPKISAVGGPAVTLRLGSPICRFALSLGGVYALVACHRRTFYYLELFTGKRARKFHGGIEDQKGASVYSVSISPNEAIAVTADSTHAIRFWDIDTRRESFSFVLRGVGSRVAFAPSGRRFVSYDEYSALWMWDLDDPGGTYSVHLERDWGLFSVSDLRFSSDGVVLYGLGTTPEGHTRIVVIEVETGVLLNQVDVADEVIGPAIFSPYGNLAMICGSASGVRIWSLNEMKEIGRLEGPRGYLTSLALSADERLALAGGSHQDPCVCLWDLQTGRLLNTFSAPAMWVGQVAFTADAQFAVAAGDIRFMWLWPVAEYR
jgi:WD40 repeat protein